MTQDFDLLYYMDADTLAIGRVEAALDVFAPNGTAAHPLGAARDHINNRRTFNAGSMAIQPDAAFFDFMMRAGRADEVPYDAKYAEQAFLNALLNPDERRKKHWTRAQQRYRWTELPQEYNLLTVYRRKDPAFFKAHLPNAALLHLAGGNGVLRHRVEYSADRGEIVATSDGPRKHFHDALWTEAWTQARRMLDLPMREVLDAHAGVVVRGQTARE